MDGRTRARLTSHEKRRRENEREGEEGSGSSKFPITIPPLLAPPIPTESQPNRVRHYQARVTVR